MRTPRTAASLVVLLTLLVAACAAPRTDQPTAGTSTTGGWSYTTGYGETITLPARPTTIVTDAYSAAALWDYGIRPAGVFGYGLEKGASPLALGDADVSAMQVVGTGGELEVEKLAALKPDLVIGFGNATTRGTSWTWWEEAVTAKVTAIAPFAGIRFTGQEVRGVIEEYKALAKALGGDVESAAVTQSQVDFETASARLQKASGAKKLSAIALNGTASSLYVGGPTLPQLSLLNDLGVTTVGPTPKTVADGESWSELSWEKVPDYPADIVLAYAGSVDAFAGIAVYRALPAVKAKQVVVWDDKLPYSYKQYAAWLGQVDTAYAGATKIAG